MRPGPKTKRAAKRQAIVAAALLLAAGASRAELAGRLFFAPQERTALDALRHADSASGARAGDVPITVNGLVSRSSGKSTVWINGAPQPESEQIAAAKKKGAAAEITVKPPGSARIHSLKVGQTLTPGSGEIRESYQHARPAAPSGTAPGGPDSAKK